MPTTALGGPVTVDVLQTALAGCLAKGWLQVVDETALGRIQEDVRRKGLLGPVYGYPSLGGVDFTQSGAEQWFGICNRCWDGGSDASFAFCDVVHMKSARYFRSESVALAERECWKDYDSVVSVRGPFPIGPWRANWWRRYPERYRIDVEERMQWQGRAPSGGAYSFFDPMKLPVDAAHARDVFDRHNLAGVEWLVLASLEDATDEYEILRNVAKSGAKLLGTRPTEAECLHGLEACLRNGWLREVDEHVICETLNLVRSDSALMPVPFDPGEHLAHVDFTVEGAQLYRMVSAEIFGPDWEDGLESFQFLTQSSPLRRVALQHLQITLVTA